MATLDLSTELKDLLYYSVLAGTTLGGVLTAAVGYGLYRVWVGGKHCPFRILLTGKTAIVTGANTGIGLETAIELARRHARVILACRSAERGERAAVDVRRISGNQNVVFTHLDLASLESVRNFAEVILKREPRIDYLINNAGVSFSSYQKTKDGFEAHMGINHLGHFLLTNLLLPRLTLSASQSQKRTLVSWVPCTRIVNVGSSLYKRSPEFDFAAMKSSVEPEGYSASRAYSQSKLANILFTRALSRRLEGTNVCTNVLHPGVIFTTELGRHHYKELSLIKKVRG